MFSNTRRAFPRYHYEAPILYAPAESDSYDKSRIINFGKGGLYFEPNRPLVPESDVRIIMVNYAAGTYGPEAFRFYVGNVRWCREKISPDNVRFAVGIRIMKKSHEIVEELVEESLHSCDLCSRVLSSSNIRQMENSVCLCEDCHSYFKTIPEGQVKNSISKFMMGNVI